MTAKQFFKSTTFKCLVALLCVLLVSGIFLTIMNSLLAVSPEERLARAIGKIYGKSVETKQLEVEQYNQDATIEEAYLVVDDGNYLIKATGKGGFDNGTVTCWVVVEMTDGAISGVGKVVIDSNVGQSYIDRVTDKALNQFGEFYEDGIIYTPALITGATVNRTKNAICNAVNGSIDYVKGHELGIVVENKFENFILTEYIDTNFSDFTVSDGKVTYSITTKGYGMAEPFKLEIVVGSDKTVESFTIVETGSNSGWEDVTPDLKAIIEGKGLSYFTSLYGEDMDYVSMDGYDGSELHAGATDGEYEDFASNSTYLCIYASAFATANYDLALTGGQA